MGRTFRGVLQHHLPCQWTALYDLWFLLLVHSLPFPRRTTGGVAEEGDGLDAPQGVVVGVLDTLRVVVTPRPTRRSHLLPVGPLRPPGPPLRPCARDPGPSVSRPQFSGSRPRPSPTLQPESSDSHSINLSPVYPKSPNTRPRSLETTDPHPPSTFDLHTVGTEILGTRTTTGTWDPEEGTGSGGVRLSLVGERSWAETPRSKANGWWRDRVHFKSNGGQTRPRLTLPVPTDGPVPT